jgi:hypothetical protein
MEKHFAYKIAHDPSRLVCTQSEFTEDKMLDLLNEIRQKNHRGIYWIFRQFNGKAQEALCLIDCEYARIYYHHSGDVESIDETIARLSRKT